VLLVVFIFPSLKEFKLGAMAHTCNPSYSGGRDLEDGGSMPAMGK
jgi:hypothetical protein